MMAIAAALVLISSLTLSASLTSAFADPLQGSTRQRISNFDFEVATDPRSPGAGSPVTVMLRFAGVNGDDLVDVPITIRIAKDGTELFRSNPIIVPYGHHSFQYSFVEPGRYALDVYVADYYSGETLTFTFPLSVAGPVEQFTAAMPIAGGIAVAALGVVVALRVKKKTAMK